MSATCFQFHFSWRLWTRAPSLPVTQNCTKILFLGKGGAGCARVGREKEPAGACEKEYVLSLPSSP